MDVIGSLLHSNMIAAAAAAGGGGGCHPLSFFFVAEFSIEPLADGLPAALVLSLYHALRTSTALHCTGSYHHYHRHQAFFCLEKLSTVCSLVFFRHDGTS